MPSLALVRIASKGVNLPSDDRFSCIADRGASGLSIEGREYAFVALDKLPFGSNSWPMAKEQTIEVVSSYFRS